MKTTNLLLSAALIVGLVAGTLSTATTAFATGSDRNQSSKRDNNRKDDDKKDQKSKKSDNSTKSEKADRSEDNRKNDSKDKEDRKDSDLRKDDDKSDRKHNGSDKKDDHKNRDHDDEKERDDAKKPAKQHRYTICHATSSEKNPYVRITVDYNSIVKKGHSQHQDHGDIIPAIPEHNFPGLNTDKLSILDNGCKVFVKGVDTEKPQTPVTPTDPETPGKGGAAPVDTPKVEILDAASTDVPAAAGLGSVATALPQTGAWLGGLLVLVAGAITASLGYIGQFVRKFVATTN